MSLSSQASTLSNCIKAPFDPVDKISPGEWSICYNQQQQKLALSVQLNVQDVNKAMQLQSTLDANGLNDLLEFLAAIKMRMNQTT